jgi:hypothetical protein
MGMECKIYAENDHTADSAKMNSKPGRSFSQASFPYQSTFLQLGRITDFFAISCSPITAATTTL